MVEFLKNIFKYVSVSLISKVFQALIVFGAASVLIKVDFANFAIFYSILQLIVVFIFAGLQEVLIGKYLNKLKLGCSRTFLGNISVLLIFQFLFISIIIFFYSFYFLNNNHLIVIVLLLSGLINSIIRLNSIVHQLEQNHSTSIKLFNSSIIIPNLIGVLILFVAKSPESFFIGFFIGSIVNLFFHLKKLNFININTLKGNPLIILNKSYPFLLTSVIAYFYGIGLTLLLNLFLNLEQVANYFFISQLIGVYLIIQGAFNQVWNPIILNNNIYSKITIKVHELLTSYLSYLIAILSGILILFLDTILLILPENLNKYIGLNLFVMLLSIGYIVFGHYNRALIYYYYDDKFKNVFLRNNLINDILGLLIVFASIYFFGEIGLYSGLGLLFIIKSLINIYPLLGILKINYKEILFCILFVFLSYNISVAFTINNFIFIFLCLIFLFSTIFAFNQNKNFKEIIFFIKNKKELNDN